MKVNIEFDLRNEEDRKLYSAYRNMREMTLNLETLREKLKEFMKDISYLESEKDRKWLSANMGQLQIYFDEMIWKKL